MGQSKHQPKIFITTGDQDGVGPEITWKALLKLPRKSYYVWTSSSTAKLLRRRLQKKYRCETIAISDRAELKSTLAKHQLRLGQLAIIESDLSPAHWVEISAELCVERCFDGIVTAPISKTLIKDAGLADLGHTDILSRVTGRPSLFMFFLGKKFSVILVTAHLPLQKVPTALTEERLRLAIQHALAARPLLGKKARWPIRVLGLNPHAGDSGLIGGEDITIIQPVIDTFKAAGQKVTGPEVPDAAFHNEKITSVYVAQYHDQGLIPFKYAHGLTGTHLTMGLPFPRTSVDHGTAKDIAGKNIADPSSMCESIQQMNAILRMKGPKIWK